MRLLITDMIWPCAIAKWRIEEICSLAIKFETDIITKGTSLPIHFEELADRFDFKLYDILIFDARFNYLNGRNDVDFDGTKYNGQVLQYVYMLRLKKYRFQTKLDFARQYDVCYHIFYDLFTSFNQSVTFPRKKQCIKLYPGGGLYGNIHLTQIDLNNVGGGIVTQKFMHLLIPERYQSILLPLYGAPYLSENQAAKTKEMNLDRPLCVSFCHLGDPVEKGEHVFREIVDLYHKTFSNDNVRFFSMGFVAPHPLVTSKGVLTQEQLDNFYRSEVDICVNPQTNVSFHAWPLSIEAVFQGCVLLTTDHRNDNLNNNFNFDEKEIVRIVPGSAEQFVAEIHKLNKNRNLLAEISQKGQKKAHELFKFENMIEPVYECLKKVAAKAKRNAFIMKNFFGYDPVLPVPSPIPQDLVTIYITSDNETAQKAKKLGWQQTIVVDVTKITTASEKLKLVCRVNCFPEEFLSSDDHFENVFVVDGNVCKLDSNYGEFVLESCCSDKTLFVTSGWYTGSRNTMRAELAASNQSRWAQWWEMTNLQTNEYERRLKEKGINVDAVPIVSAKYIGWNLLKKTQSTIANEFFGEYGKHNQGNIILSFLTSFYPDSVFNYGKFANDGQVHQHRKMYI